jgi:4-oxalocrotonate tautomerase
MPLVRIELIRGRSETDLVAIGNAIHRALVECLNVPERDHFQIITEHSAGRLLYDSGYLGIERTDGIVFVQVFLSAGRTTEQKKAFYARVPVFSQTRREWHLAIQRLC